MEHGLIVYGLGEPKEYGLIHQTQAEMVFQFMVVSFQVVQVVLI